MKIEIQSIQEISPIILLSVLLFVSCTQLPIVEENTESDLSDAVEEMPADALDMDSEVILTETEIDPSLEEQLPDNDVPLLDEVVEEDLMIDDLLNDNLEISIDESQQATMENFPEAVEEIVEDLPSPEELARINAETLINQRNVEALC